MEPKFVNVHEAKTHLSRLLQEVEAGADIVIARNGKPIARLSSVCPPPPRLRELGFLKVPPGLDLSLENLNSAWDDEDWAEWEREQDEYFGPVTDAPPA